MKAQRTKYQLAKLQGYLDGRVARYTQCSWSDSIVERWSQALGDWWDSQWDDDCRIVYIEAMHTTSERGRIACDIENLLGGKL